MKSVPCSTPLRRFRHILVAAATVAAPLSAATIYKDATTLDLLDVTGWSTSGSSATPDPVSIGTTDTLRFNELFAPTSGTIYTATIGSNLTVGALRMDFGASGGGTAYGNVTISGSGVLTLNGNTDYVAAPAQGIVLNSATGGSLTVASNVALGASQRWVASRNLTVSGNVNLGASTLTFWSAGGTTSISGIISGSGGLVRDSSSAGAVVLTGANTYTGSTVVNLGVIRVTGSGQLGGAAGGTTDAGNLVFGSANSDMGLEFETAANLGAINQVRFRNTGGTAGSGGVLRYIGNTAQTVGKVLQSDSSIGIRLESNSAAGSVTFNGGFSQTNRPIFLGGTGTGANTLASVFAGSGTLTKNGPGRWVLSGLNTYTGNTVINAGVLELASTGKMYNGGFNNSAVVTVNAGGTWRVVDYSYSGVGQLADYAERRVLAGGVIEVTGNSHGSGQNFTVGAAGGTFRYSPSGQTLTLSGNSNGNILLNGALVFDAIGNISVSEVIETTSGTGSLSKAGSGILTLSGANTFLGRTTLTAGTLAATSPGALGLGTAADSLTLAGGTLRLARDTATTFGAGAGIGATLAGNAAISVDRGTAGAGVAHQIGSLQLGGRTLTLSKGANVTSGSATLVLGGALGASADSGIAVGEGVVLDVANGASTGGTTLTKSGAGVLILRAGSNLGGLNVTGGRVHFASSTSLAGGEGTLAFADGTSFDNTSGGDVTFSSSKALSFAGTVAFVGSNSLGLGSGSGALAAATTLQIESGTLTLGGDLTGAFGLTKTGAGALVISGLGSSTAYSGDTLIGAGELSLVNGSSFRSGTTVTLSSGAILRLGSGSGLSNVTFVNNGGTLFTTETVTAPQTYSSDITLDGSNNIDGTQTIAAGATVSLSGDHLGTNPGSPTQGRIVLSAGATLRATQTFTIGANKGIALGAGSATFSSDSGKSLVIESVLSGAGSLVKAGGGGLRLTGANTFAGDVTIQGGTLGIASDASLGAGSAVTLDGGTLVAAQGTTAVTVSSSRAVTLSGGKTSGLDATTGGSLTYDGAIGQSGPGAASLRIGTAGARLGTVYLGGANTYTGATTVAAGTLVLKSGASLGSGAVSIGSGATLANQGVIGGAVTASAGATLKGTGTFQGLVTVEGTHAPGNSPGIQVFGSGLSFASSSVLEWEFQGDTLAGRGTDYDGVNVTGGLLTVDPAATLKVINLSAVDYSAPVWAQARTFEVVSLTGAAFGATHQFGTLDLSAAGNFGSKGSWGVVYSLNSTDGVYLQWTPVPEPGTYGFALGALTLALAALRRKARAQSRLVN